MVVAKVQVTYVQPQQSSARGSLLETGDMSVHKELYWMKLFYAKVIPTLLGECASLW